MCTEYRGRVKRKFWLQPPCVVRGGEPDEAAEEALATFKHDCKQDREPFHVASADMIADAFEDYEEAEYPVE